MSTSYQIVFGDKDTTLDIEESFRFNKVREMDHVKQTQWQFEIFRSSMNSKIQAATIVAVIYLMIAIVYYIVVVENMIIIKPTV